MRHAICFCLALAVLALLRADAQVVEFKDLQKEARALTEAFVQAYYGRDVPALAALLLNSTETHFATFEAGRDWSTGAPVMAPNPAHNGRLELIVNAIELTGYDTILETASGVFSLIITVCDLGGQKVRVEIPIATEANKPFATRAPLANNPGQRRLAPRTQYVGRWSGFTTGIYDPELVGYIFPELAGQQHAPIEYLIGTLIFELDDSDALKIADVSVYNTETKPPAAVTSAIYAAGTPAAMCEASLDALRHHVKHDIDLFYDVDTIAGFDSVRDKFKL